MPILFYDTKDAVPADLLDAAQEITEGENKGKFGVNVVPRKKMEIGALHADECLVRTHDGLQNGEVVFEAIGRWRRSGHRYHLTFKGPSELSGNLTITMPAMVSSARQSVAPV